MCRKWCSLLAILVAGLSSGCLLKEAFSGDRFQVSLLEGWPCGPVAFTAVVLTITGVVGACIVAIGNIVGHGLDTRCAEELCRQADERAFYADYDGEEVERG